MVKRSKVKEDEIKDKKASRKFKSNQYSNFIKRIDRGSLIVISK